MVFEKVKKIIVETLNLKDASKVTLEAHLVNDLGADSLDVVEMLLELEKEYGVEITDEQAADLKTVGDIVNLVDNK